jgi:DNA gyrase subunit A
MGRSTQGVSLISLDEGTTLAGIEKLCEPEDPNGNGHDAAPGSDEAPGADAEPGEP